MTSIILFKQIPLLSTNNEMDSNFQGQSTNDLESLDPSSLTAIGREDSTSPQLAQLHESVTKHSKVPGPLRLWPQRETRSLERLQYKTLGGANAIAMDQPGVECLILNVFSKLLENEFVKKFYFMYITRTMYLFPLFCVSFFYK